MEFEGNITSWTLGDVVENQTSLSPPEFQICLQHKRWIHRVLGNLSFDLDNITAAMALLTKSDAHYDWFEIVIPIICFLGIVGNILNLLVLTRRRLLSSMDRLEKSANYGMIALAVSDMFFCIMVFPHTFISQSVYSVDLKSIIILYYKIYGIALINLFLMISTWLIVVMAANRYIVVVYPLQARQVLGTARTIVTIMMVFFLCTLLTMPHFLNVTVSRCVSYDGEGMWEVRSRWRSHPKVARSLKIYIRWCWPVVAEFIPVIVLAFCNARLIQELRHAISSRRRSCHGQVVRDSSHKVTLTLVIIVLMLLLLVSPSEILRFIDPYKSWGEIGHIVTAVTNVMQTCNFAFNFVLYCAVNANFRQTIRAMFSRCLRDQGEKPELQSMLTHNNIVTERTLMTDTELS